MRSGLRIRVPVLPGAEKVMLEGGVSKGGCDVRASCLTVLGGGGMRPRMVYSIRQRTKECSYLVGRGHSRALMSNVVAVVDGDYGDDALMIFFHAIFFMALP